MSSVFNIKAIQFGHTICKEDWHVSEEKCIFYRFYYVRSGEATYYDSIREMPLQRGYLYLFPIHKAYTIAHNPNCPLECTWFHVEIVPTIIDSVLEISVKQNTVLFYILKTLYEVIDQEKQKTFILEPLLEILFDFVNQDSTFNVLRDERIKEAIQYIHQYSNKKILTDELADLVGLESSYFIRLFKRVMGISPQQYSLNYKCTEACRDLLEGKSVEYIAYAVGFEDSKAFSRAFKRVKGISPTAYRKSQYLQP